MRDPQFRVLVVDDEAPMREELAIQLKEYNFKVETAENGEEGLEKILTDEFDVAIIDLKMPRMTGLELIRKANAEDVDAYVIILTGKGNKEDAIAALKLQRTVKDWFEKSNINFDVLVERVQKLAEGVPYEEVSRILAKVDPTEA